MDKFKIVTHDGTFHGDEVFGCALMGKFYPGRIEIERSRDPEVIATADMVLDVGEVYDIKTARLDHHQESYTGTRQKNFNLFIKKFFYLRKMDCKIRR